MYTISCYSHCYLHPAKNRCFPGGVGNWLGACQRHGQGGRQSDLPIDGWMVTVEASNILHWCVFSLLIYIHCIYIYIWNVYETIWICNMLQNVARPLADGVDLSAAMLDNQKWYGKASNISITNLIQTTEENEVSKSLNFGIDKSIGVKDLGSEDIPMDPQIAGQSSWGRLADQNNFAQQPRLSPKLGTWRSYWILNDTVDGRNPFITS